MVASAGPSAHVLVVDDDEVLGMSLRDLLRQAGFSCRLAASGTEALALLDEAPVDAVVTDVRMPGMDGMALLERVKERTPEVAVVMITAHGSVPLAVRAMQLGAADFILKPFDREEVLRSVEKAVALTRHAETGPAPASPASSPGDLLRASRGRAELEALLARAAGSAATVLLVGETGTGKSLAARAIHEQSSRAKEPLVTVHCAALPEALLESELFGYERGAFTGAQTRKPGRVELAGAGTLLLDEIGDVPLGVQPKLLRLLQERAYEPLGGTRTQKTDARFVAATHRDLADMVARGTFREDLLYRLDVLVVRMPPLRDRPDDVPALATRFCARHAATNDKAGTTLGPDAIALLAEQPWPGNVRQLENLVERLVVFADTPTVGARDVEVALASGLSAAPSRRSPAVDAHRSAARSLDAPLDLGERRAGAEREAIERALDRARGNRTQAARILGVSRRTLYNKLAEHGVA